MKLTIWIHFFFANLSCFHSLSIADSVRGHFRFREFVSYFEKIPWINYLFYNEFTVCCWWIYYVFIIYFANLLWINFLFREVTKNSLSVSRIHYGFIILFREFTIFYRMVCIVFTCLPWWNVLFYIMFILRNWNRLRHNMNDSYAT